MANILKHRFVSAKAAGTDPTQVQPTHWNDGHIFSGGNAGDLLTRDPTDASFGAAWATLANVGGRLDVAYNAANFFGGGPMGWSVVAGSQTTFAYAIASRMAFMILTLTGTTVSGAASSPLNVTLPVMPAKNSDTVGYAVNNGVGISVRVRIVSSDPTLRLYPMVPSGNWDLSAANTNISIQFVVPV